MKVSSIKKGLIIIGIMIVICSIITEVSIMPEVLVWNGATIFFFITMMCGIMLMLSSILIEDKYTTYDELQKVKK